MKYLKVLANESAYETFKNSEECVTPHICYLNDSHGIRLKEKQKLINEITIVNKGNDKYYIRATYPVTSSLHITITHGKTTWVEDTIMYIGKTESLFTTEPCMNSEGYILDSITPQSDDTYDYVLKNNGLTFPVYLDNSDLELGVEVYNYLYNKYKYNDNYRNIDEEVYVYYKNSNIWYRLKRVDYYYGNYIQYSMVNSAYYCNMYPDGNYLIITATGGD